MSTNQLVEHFFRHEYARLVASLTHRLGVKHFALVEDVVQFAMQRALASWSRQGVPPRPAAWLFRVAHHRAIDLLRRDGRWSSLSSAAEQLADRGPSLAEPVDDEIDDAQLRMIFVCCDPAIPAESQIALALKTLCGFSTSEIARALLTTEANIAKRITRAKEKLRGVGLDPAAMTADHIVDRLPIAQSVIYLLFNEGYSSSLPDRVIREELCEEAVRLAHVLARHRLTAGSTTAAFLALLLFHAARLDERLDPSGALNLIDRQDRSKWDLHLLDEAFHWFREATQGETLTRYHVEAWLAAEHCRAPSVGSTDWGRVVDAYNLLVRLAPSPIHELNRAIAIGQRDGPAAGLAVLRAIPSDRVPAGYYLWHATTAELARQSGNPELARKELVLALELAPTHAEKSLLAQRLASLGG